jgi:hypothetical protein
MTSITDPLEGLTHSPPMKKQSARPKGGGVFLGIVGVMRVPLLRVNAMIHSGNPKTIPANRQRSERHLSNARHYRDAHVPRHPDT